MKRYKITTFVPVSETEKVLGALGDAGAGHIGNYSHCSYVLRGEGRFKPEEGADPTIGEVGKLEKVDEHRIETVCTEDKLKQVVTALIQTHPYEEVAYDVVELVDVQEFETFDTN